jgi:hypothetical protein
MSKSLGAFAEIGRELKHINENELFLARYPTFMEFVHAAEPEATGIGETVGTLIHHRDVEESDLFAHFSTQGQEAAEVANHITSA